MELRIRIDTEGNLSWYCSICSNRITIRDGIEYRTLMHTSSDYIFKEIMRQLQGDAHVFICENCIRRAKEYASKGI